MRCLAGTPVTSIRASEGRWWTETSSRVVVIPRNVQKLWPQAFRHFLLPAFSVPPDQASRFFSSSSLLRPPLIDSLRSPSRSSAVGDRLTIAPCLASWVSACRAGVGLFVSSSHRLIVSRTVSGDWSFVSCHLVCYPSKAWPRLKLLRVPTRSLATPINPRRRI